MAKTNFVPQRMCVACRTMKEKSQLFRLVVTDNVLTLDESYKQSGRGVYLCKCSACIERLKKNKNFVRQYGQLSDRLVATLEGKIEQ